MRLFVCTLLNAENQAVYGRAMGDLISANRDILRPIPRGSAHLTYAFLPHVDPSRTEVIVQAMTAVATRHPPVEIGLGIPFILSGGSEARLICTAVVDGAAPLSVLAMDIVKEMSQRADDLNLSGSKSLHATLARFRKGTRGGQVRRVADALRRSALTPRDTIAHVQVMSSQLTPAGPLYNVLHESMLNGT